MYIKKCLFGLTTVVLMSSLFAQDNGESPRVTSVFSDSQSTSTSWPAVDTTPVAGKRTRGLAVPEGTAILTFLRRDNAEILSRLPAQDSLRFSSAIVALKSARLPVADMENLCRRAIDMNENGYSEADVLTIGEGLAAADSAEKKAALETYAGLLRGVGAESAALIREEKAKLHESLASFETDWIAQSKDQPEWLLENFANNCDRNLQR